MPAGFIDLSQEVLLYWVTALSVAISYFFSNFGFEL